MPADWELELERTAGELSTRISELSRSFVRHAEQDAGETELLGELAVNCRELAEHVGGLSNTVRSYWVAIEKTQRTKRAQEAMTCAKCGTKYEAEPGPPLCGPCWISEGRPKLWAIPTGGNNGGS